MRLSNAVATSRAVQRTRAARYRWRALQPQSIPTGKLSFVFNATNPEVIEWAEVNAANMITEISAGTKRGVRGLVQDMFLDGISPARAAREIRRLVPLNSIQRRAVRNLERELRNPENFGRRITRFGPRPGVRDLPGFRVRVPKGGLSESALQRRLAQYTRMQRNWRARNIARTESIRAANEGQRQAWMQARERGEISKDAEREWSAATGDNRTCPTCEELDGTTAPLDGNFAGGIDGPPAHQMCRCSTALVSKGAGRKPPPPEEIP